MRFINRFLITFLIPSLFFSCVSAQKRLGDLTNGAKVYFIENEKDEWGLALTQSGSENFKQAAPVHLEFYNQGTTEEISMPYSSVSIENNKATGHATVKWRSCVFEVKDVWTLEDNELLVDRKVALEGSGDGGFMSSISLYGMKNFSRNEADFFVPGMIYGDLLT